MRIPLEWLKEYIDIKIGLKDLANKLTMSGTEIESLDYGANFDNIVVGEIIDIRNHPNVSKLQITDINIGQKVLQIVCGASNIEIGQKVPVALVGAQLGEFKIDKINMRGVESEGMLCSEAELGISDDHSGIMILDPRAQIGSNISNSLEIGGAVLDAEITPNRGDLLSILGIARELKAILNKPVKEPKISFAESSLKVQDYLNVDVKDFDLCPRYIVRVLEVPEIDESPKWIQDRLAAYGIRPLNSVVDITNYVMAEYGQPLHAFDGEKIGGHKIIVRKANNNESIKTLDGIERKLSKENLVIADAKKPIAIAGVMGGLNSEVDLSSRIIVLESAKFNKVSVRRTGNSLALRTEAVLRFEKEIPFELPAIALDRACQLLENICEAKIYKGKQDIFKSKPKQKQVDLPLEKVAKILGIEISEGEIIKILKSLDFSLIKKKDNVYSFLVPWWRLDVSIPEDLVEEIARIYGYDKIPATLPSGQLPELQENKSLKYQNILKANLIANGFNEVYTYSFIGQELLKKVNTSDKNLLQLQNPLSPEQEYLRPSLVPSILEVAGKNIKNFDKFKIFEIARIYLPSKKKLPEEEKRLTGVIVGEGDNSYYAVKDIVKIMLQSLGIFYSDKKIEISPVKPTLLPEDNIFHPSRVAQLRIDNKLIGLLGEIKPNILDNFGIKKRVGVFSLSFDQLVRYATSERKYVRIPKFPATKLDLALVLDQKIPEIDVRKTIIASSGDLLYKIELFDIFTGRQLGSDKKNLAYHLTFQSKNHTLEEKEILAIKLKISRTLKAKLKAEIRERK